ncbi:hypothetical protein J3F83DRAFT_749908 [Trichoderma novae-zelandiae]
MLTHAGSSSDAGPQELPIALARRHSGKRLRHALFRIALQRRIRSIQQSDRSRGSRIFMLECGSITWSSSPDTVLCCRAVVLRLSHLFETWSCADTRGGRSDTTNNTSSNPSPSMASLAHFALMASTASGALLALSNFQGLTTSVPVQCLYAYNLPIQRCAPADFVGGGSCSQACISGLQAAQFTVRGLCFNVNAPANSLLRQILEGNILGVLCGTGKTPTTTTSVAPPKQTPSKPAASPNPKTTPSMAPRPIFSTLSTSTNPTTSTTPSALPETTTSVASSTSTTAQASTTSETVLSSTTTSTAEAPSSPGPQPSNNEQPSSSSSTTTRQPKPTRPPNLQPGSGGGSPFDFVPASRAAKLGLAGGSVAMAVAIVSATLMLL